MPSRDEIRQQIHELCRQRDNFGFQLQPGDKKLSPKEFEEAVASLIDQQIREAERKLEDQYSWDSWSLGWKKDKHHRQLVLMKDGKIVTHQAVIDGEFCTCEPYRHSWPTLKCCIEKWAQDQLKRMGNLAEAPQGREMS